MIALWRNTLRKSKRMIIEEEVKIWVQKQLFRQKKRIFTDLCLLVWLNPQISFWLCEYKSILFHIVCKSCNSQDSRIWCSRIFEAKISRNLLKQFKISLESDLISTQKLCFECVQTFGARICQLVNGMEENIRNTKVKNLVQRATNWIWTMQKTAFLGMLEAKVTSMWKSAKAVSQKLGKLSGHQMDARVNTNFCTQIWKT